MGSSETVFCSASYMFDGRKRRGNPGTITGCGAAGDGQQHFPDEAPEIKRKIISLITQRKLSGPCPLCQTTNWLMPDGFVTIRLEEDSKAFTIGSTNMMPCVVLVCKEAGPTLTMHNHGNQGGMVGRAFQDVLLESLSEGAVVEGHWGDSTGWGSEDPRGLSSFLIRL